MFRKATIMKFFSSLLQPVVAFLVALLIGTFLILPSGTGPIAAYREMFIGAFGSVNALANTFTRATPLIFTGLAAAFAFRAGIFNIGAEGQLYWGALAATWVLLTFETLPGMILVPLAIIAAMIGGALWAFPAGFFKIKLGINIVISTIMLNWIAQYLTTYVVAYPMKGELDINASLKIGESGRLLRLMPPTQLNLGFVIALVAGIIVFFILNKSSFGYELRAIGKNIKFAAYAGVKVNRKILQGIMISGALAGLAGAEQVMGFHYRFIGGFSPGYAFTGITAALLGRLNPIATVFAAILLGAIESGALKMEIATNVSRDLTLVLQSIIILLLGAEQLIKLRKMRQPSQNEEKEEEA